ncbi:hydrolase [Bacillus infantis]|nr:hydrolase [Bacillus infantis]
MTRMENRKVYYISVASGEISQSPDSSPWNFKIEANDEEITRLREYFDQNHSTDWQNFFRAHVPYVQYHYDRENDAYDEGLAGAYKMIYELGDEEARKHIDEMGILGKRS